jgi:hypothetical protein
LALAVGIPIWASAQLRPTMVQEQFKRPIVEQRTRKALKEVELTDGRKVQAYVQENEPVTRDVTVTREVTTEPSDAERLWYYIMAGAAILLGLYVLGLIAAWFVMFVRRGGKRPPKFLEDLLKPAVSSLLGMVVGFAGGNEAVHKPPKVSQAPTTFSARDPIFAGSPGTPVMPSPAARTARTRSRRRAGAAPRPAPPGPAGSARPPAGVP